MDRCAAGSMRPETHDIAERANKYYKTNTGKSNSRNRVRVASEMERFENVVVCSRGRWLEGWVKNVYNRGQS